MSSRDWLRIFDSELLEFAQEYWRRVQGLDGRETSHIRDFKTMGSGEELDSLLSEKLTRIFRNCDSREIRKAVHELDIIRNQATGASPRKVSPGIVLLDETTPGLTEGGNYEELFG